ncbi:hypothetical protein Acr_11g0005040 [Actinidia rufa]|uniref:Uncharacterized protein n=1 Tax=Actinidia rufa TaxID=165716 RepID=A0A7J0FC09_9ERIC|nr:hypothetical protein Acr_11g0005040 [Actinidia rufa]
MLATGTRGSVVLKSLLGHQSERLVPTTGTTAPKGAVKLLSHSSSQNPNMEQELERTIGLPQLPTSNFPMTTTELKSLYNSELKKMVAYAFPKYAATMPTYGQILPKLLAWYIKDNLAVSCSGADETSLELVDIGSFNSDVSLIALDDIRKEKQKLVDGSVGQDGPRAGQNIPPMVQNGSASQHIPPVVQGGRAFQNGTSLDLVDIGSFNSDVSLIALDDIRKEKQKLVDGSVRQDGSSAGQQIPPGSKWKCKSAYTTIGSGWRSISRYTSRSGMSNGT